MKTKIKAFEQHLFHDMEDNESVEEHLEISLPLVGLIVMYFNYLEQRLDSYLCQIFTDRSDSTGLIVLDKMNYSSKVDLLKRFSDDLHLNLDCEIQNYSIVINNLKESGRLRNLVVHADWWNTDIEGYTYVNFKITKKGMSQEYTQFSKESLEKIIELIITTNNELDEYWEEREEILLNYPNHKKVESKE